MLGFQIRSLLLTALATAALGGQPNRESMLVSTAWLASHLSDRDLVILHVGGQEDYAAGHIPGARKLSLSDISISGPDNLRLELPPLEDLRTALAKVGIRNDSRIVVYPANESVQSATRVWFTLDYAGLGQRASLLDGGLLRWKEEGRPLTTDAIAVHPGTLTLTPDPSLVVSAEWLQGRLKDPDLLLVDARLPEFYTGANPGQMPRAGRIPGAVNVPYNSLVDAQLRLRSVEDLRKVIPAGKEVVAYCHIGQQATLVFFVARMLGEKVRLYDGSFQEWSRRANLAVETGAR
jgi:thiosulfate/3-mercaptopyruvate sulfurtransferase